MNRAVLVGLALLAALLTFLVLAGSSEGRCGVNCLRNQVNALRLQYLPLRMKRLEARVEAQSAYVSWLQARSSRLEARLSELTGCLGEVPLARYGEEQGPSGYLFRLESPEEAQIFPTTALDISYPDDPVGFWAFANTYNPDRVTPISSQVRQDREQATRFGAGSTLGQVFR
jgi:hypothetical protein